MALTSLKAATLRHVAFLTGEIAAGTKGHLASHLHSSLSRFSPMSGGGRVLSVDMGIRNLAFCVVDIPKPSATSGNAWPDPTTQTRMDVKAWKRLDLLDKFRPTAQAMPMAPSSSSSDTKLADASLENDDATQAPESAILKDSFTPSVMSKAALDITRDLLAYEPDHILIERQRFRSGGGSAIQEWTVRVNILESMIWACLETLKSIQSESQKVSFATMHEVLPKRVASFWTAPLDAQRPFENPLHPGYVAPDTRSLDSEGSPVKPGKKEKIAVLRSWLQGEGGVALGFGIDTQEIADLFAIGASRRKAQVTGKKRAGSSLISYETKLDDLADCILQAAAWVRWEENKELLRRALRDKTET